jgi:CHAT domain-containing protein
MQPLSVEQIASRVPEGLALVIFTASRQHVLATVVERNRFAMHRVADTVVTLESRKKRLRDAIRHGHRTQALELAADLYESLISSLALTPKQIKNVVIVSDQPIKDIPFSFLRDRRHAQFLIEQFNLLHVSSASVFLQTATRHSSAQRPRTALTIGDPAFDRRVYPSLPLLPASKAESLGVARRYSVAASLVGSRATLRNIATAARAADIIDIAAHTVRSVEDPSLSHLLLAPDGEFSGACSVGDITSLRLKSGSTVVIAGCGTAINHGQVGDLRDFTGAFLAAGAGSAIGTLWDVDDDDALNFALLFHHALETHDSPAAATRDAQLAMLRSHDARLQDPRAWSGFQVYTRGH